MKNWCWNDDRPAKADDPECVVGTIRKMRNRIMDDDGTCRTCPYFMSESTSKETWTICGKHIER